MAAWGWRRNSRAAALAVLLVAAALPAVSEERQQAVELSRASLLLARATYGPRPGDLDALLELGTEAWLDRQLHPERLDDAQLEKRLARFETLSLSVPQLLARYPQPSREERSARLKAREAAAAGSDDGEALPARRREGDNPRPGEVVAELSQAKLLRAIGSERQLEAVLTDFWFNHFNVYARKSRNTILLLPSFEAEAIRPHVLGRFEDLLLAVARHPAMLIYLDNWINTREGFDPRASARGLRAGAGRVSRWLAGQAQPVGQRRTFGINENYARELLELHTLGVDGGYDQKDVVEVARCLTGWTTTPPRRGRGGSGERGPRLDGQFHFNALAHDPRPKTVLGETIDAGGVEDGREVIRLIAAHPSTARFISFKLAQRFVSDAPSEELVSEMAASFLKSDGDLRSVLKTMFGSPRFLSEGRQATKVKTPLELVASVVRATSASVTDPRGLVRAVQVLGMPLYQCQPPTGYAEEASEWLSAGSTLNRIRFIGQLVGNEVRGVEVRAPRGDLAIWSSAILPLEAGGLSAEAEATLRDALAEFPDVARSKTLSRVALVLTSPAFQRQ